jgi:hypothetical protein
MTHNAVREFLICKRITDTVYLDTWTGVRKRMITQSEFRNALAHFTRGNLYRTPTDPVSVLMPTLFDPMERYRREDRIKKKLDPLDTNAIKQAGIRFRALAVDIDKFTHLVESLAQETPQPAEPPLS